MGTQNSDPSVMEFVWMTLVAISGTFVRANRWLDPNGKFVPYRCITELATAPALAVLAGGLADKYNLDSTLKLCIAGILALVGPAIIVEGLSGIIRTRLGIGGNDVSNSATKK